MSTKPVLPLKVKIEEWKSIDVGLAWLDLWWFLPTMGLSPTRPGRLAVIPPVEVAAAVEPLLSSATAPTVSWPSVSHTADVDGVASLQSEKKKLKV